MKILYASTLFPHPCDPTRGTYNLKLCQALSRLHSGDQGHEVAVVAPRNWQAVIKKRPRTPLETDGFVSVAYPTFYYVPGYKRRQLADWLDWSMRAAVKRATHNWKPDIVLSYWADPDGRAAMKWAHRLGAKFAVIVGGTDVLMLPHRPALAGLIEETLEQADLVATVSDQLTNAVEKLCPDLTNVACLRQGIDETILYNGSKIEARAKLGLPTDKPMYTWVGRLDPIKNLPLLLDAFSRVRAKVDAQLAIVGDGPERGSVTAKVNESGLSNAVHLAGSIAPNALGDWYRAADATVLSSRSEGLPNVLRESLACGRPFASVDVGGISEIGDASCRILTPPGESVALAEAMSDVLDSAYQQAAKQYPVRTWHDAALDFEAAFEQLLSQRSARVRDGRREVVLG